MSKIHSKFSLIVIAIFASTSWGCGDDIATGGDVSTQGRFSANLNSTNYDVPVECSGLGTSTFMFLSDDTDINDTNMDGLIISGFAEADGDLVLTVIDEGNTFSSANISEWSTNGSTVSGSGTLFLEGSAMSFPVTFSVDC